MGSCFGKPKKNKVGHSPREGELRKKASSKIKKRTALDVSDMEQQLQEAAADEIRITKGGMCFTLDSSDGDATRMPSRLADRLDGALTPESCDGKVHYSAEEKEILAELLRDDILREKSEKARREIQAYDAARRRAAMKT